MIVQCTFVKMMPIHELKIKFHPKNRNQHPDDQITRLADILKYQGIRSPVKISNLSGLITAGHGRVLAAERNGWTEMPVDFQDYESEEQEYADVQADNAIASWAELDLSGINADLGDLGPDFDIDMLGIKDFVLEPADLIPQSDEDAVPENVDTRCKLGDVWTLGRHRLMCGDSTNIDAVEKLMNGEKADMVFTDPPYGIGFKYNSHQDSTGDEYKDFCKDWFRIINCFSKFIIISTGWAYNGFWYSYEPKDCFYWLCKNKRTGGSISHFRKVEPIFIWGKPENRYDFDFWEQTTQIEEDLKGKHTCPKPVNLIEQILSGGKNKGTVLDVFGGSGTTLIACEKTNRKCFMMEIDPHYCDVILKRWEDYTGQTATIEDNAAPRLIGEDNRAHLDG